MISKNNTLFAIEQNINVIIMNKVNLQLSIKNQLIGAYIHFDSFLTNTYKIGMVYN